MLSYQHIYHAGNAADVQKHLWLIATLRQLRERYSSFHWLDTHGGRGLYDLSAPEAVRLGEYKDGFLKFRAQYEQRQDLSPVARLYLNMVREASSRRKLYYPGSALIAAKMLRSCDKLSVCELHKGEIEHLKTALSPYDHVTISKTNGYEQLIALPKETIGGVLIDPSYEIKSEYQDVLMAVKTVHARLPDLTMLIWYPLLTKAYHKEMIAGFKGMQNNGVNLHLEEIIFATQNPSIRGLYGSGMIVINGAREPFEKL